MLSKISQTKTNTSWYHLHVKSKGKKKIELTERKNKKVVTRDWRVWKIEKINKSVNTSRYYMNKF